uniref:Uncharacterized protein n=1 Tax=Ralstonia syzygii R24 TaxID=907261 RepID=G3A334_9RALS|nr:hypothetical protein RALSY_30008 [Ralstonia syzygii R24]
MALMQRKVLLCHNGAPPSIRSQT